MANLKLNTVSKIYPSGALALYKINLELSDSEFVAVVGGEKSGKTTLLRVISGIEKATEGQVIIGDKDMTEEEPRERDVAVIFQGNTLYPSLSVYDNMAYGLKIRKASQTLIEQRVKVAAEILGLTEVLYRKPKALTSEQKQLVAFGRAIVREPKLYLLDDPLSGINGELRSKLRSVLINLQIRMKGTFVYATKNVNEALTMATRVLVLKEGMFQQIDTPANLYDYPANAYVAFTVGSPTVNFVNDAQIVKEEGKVFVCAQELKLQLPENIVKRFENIEEYISCGKKVILGIRPEDIAAGKQGAVPVTVSEAENIAGTDYAQCEAGKLTLVAKAEGVTKGDSAALDVDMSHALIFDAVTRLTLLSRDGGYVSTGLAGENVMPLSYEDEENIKKKFKLPQTGKKKK